MKLSVGMTIYERETPVLDAVFGSLRGQPFDEMVVVLDRTPVGIEEHCRKAWGGDERVRFERLEGPPGWGSPVPAWNRFFAEATGDFLFAFSSEVVHAPQNIEVASRMLEVGPQTVVFGKCMCSCGRWGHEVNWGGEAPGNLLVDAAHPRPLGFIWAGPIANVQAIGGMDTEFAGGFCYDDDDFFMRLWRTGLDFVFTDEISGTHLHHNRPGLASEAGQAGIRRNEAIMVRKYGTIRPWLQTKHHEIRSPGLTRWSHP